MFNQRRLMIFALSVVMGVSVACTKHPSDDVIAKDIQDKVASDPDTKDSAVSVASKEGKVTLTGKVKTPAAQQKVEKIAREEPGAVGLDDQTMIEPEGAAGESAAPMTAAAPTPAPEPPKPQP